MTDYEMLDIIFTIIGIIVSLLLALIMKSKK